MPSKYERIPDQQLHDLKDNFIKFLIVQGIDASTWETIKTSEPERAADSLDMFSDVIWETSLQSIHFLRIETESVLYLYQIMTDKAYVLILQCESETLITSWTKSFITEHWDALEISKGEKSDIIDRGAFIYELIQQGAITDDGALYKSLIVRLA